MAIDINRYVSITSGVGGGAAVRARDFILRLFSVDPRVPSGAVVEMESSDDVATFFGTSSPEYLRAVQYFGYLSTSISKPEKISFSRWADIASAARIYGASATRTVSQFSSVTAGAIKLTIGTYTADVTGLGLNVATTLSQVASILQTAIRAVSAGGAQWTGATVTYNAVSSRFELVSGATGAAAISTAAPASGTDIRTLIGWDSTAIFSAGVAAQEPVDALIASVGVSDNFGSFAFQTTLTTEQILAVSQQNDTYNNKFLYLLRTAQADAASYYAALKGLSGVCATLASYSNQFDELLPACELASTDYSKRDAAKGYMYIQAALTPTVLDGATATLMENSRVNFYGRTQTAGQFLDFYQRGVLMGLATDAVDINTYANEIWLKDAMLTSWMSLQLAKQGISANTRGRAEGLATMQDVIDRGLRNGTISVGKPLNVNQRLYVTSSTGDDNAWLQVQNIGYWMGLNFESYVTTDGRTEWKAVYTLIYSKDDKVRKVEGTHILI
jgi:hypothetical protein